MRLTWRQRLEQQPSLRAFEHWPNIPLDTLPRSRRKGFLRNQMIVAQALASEPLEQVAHRHNVTPGRVSQLLDRCLGGDESTPPALIQGLIPYRTIVTKQRQSPLPTHGKQLGTACSFKMLLKEVPGLREGLDAMIQAKLKDLPYAQRIAPQAFHDEFKRLLAEAHWPQDRYPHTTESLAYESVRRYLSERTAELERERQQRRQPASRNLSISKKVYRALRAIQIDEHTLDLRERVHLLLNDELIPLRLARASVLVATDVDTECTLGYYLSPSHHPNQQDMLTLLDNCLQPWHPLTLATPGLSYTPGARFPSGLDDAFPISFGTVQLDNALMHQAQSVIELLCQHYGATLNLGWPAMPKVRERVESVFDFINEQFSHRVASTTGSHPTDQAKESRKNQLTPPIITFQTVNEALSVILSEGNITPRAALGNAAPLELLQHHCATHFVRFVPQLLSQQWQPLIGSVTVPLHWYRHESRMPHITFFYERYQGPGLLRVAGKVSHIRVMFDRRDIRMLHAISLNGEDLGELQVSTPWQRFPHTLGTRQWIHKNIKRFHFNARDPLGAYFRFLLEHRGNPEVALSLLRVYNEFTAGIADHLVLGESREPIVSAPSWSPKTSTTVWHPDRANHRG